MVSGCGAAATAMLNDLVAVPLPESVTFAVKLEVPDAFGVPEMTPDEAFNERPDGSDPLLIAHA